MSGVIGDISIEECKRKVKMLVRLAMMYGLETVVLTKRREVALKILNF